MTDRYCSECWEREDECACLYDSDCRECSGSGVICHMGDDGYETESDCLNCGGSGQRYSDDYEQERTE